ncbi:uncharacterized protein LY79DRAFT_56474 [Colletotrichum navitas]|uniref:Uncharacterized protein n=1 Tax=Colletotrichum navitas TaxID=681940 RepID=A0AAD8PLL5_9PEZI|nr:uncharacterized protein LY79DRAFT_56474 [Colletotrichum navitas]KAK1569975.1 hypothetical protein LY79DRAFT_56474 [Colletotrichum navitas]
MYDTMINSSFAAFFYVSRRGMRPPTANVSTYSRVRRPSMVMNRRLVRGPANLICRTAVGQAGSLSHCPQDPPIYFYALRQSKLSSAEDFGLPLRARVQYVCLGNAVCCIPCRILEVAASSLSLLDRFQPLETTTSSTFPNQQTFFIAIALCGNRPRASDTVDNCSQVSIGLLLLSHTESSSCMRHRLMTKPNN